MISAISCQRIIESNFQTPSDNVFALQPLAGQYKVILGPIETAGTGYYLNSVSHEWNYITFLA
jgi:hypothetical protein